MRLIFFPNKKTPQGINKEEFTKETEKVKPRAPHKRIAGVTVRIQLENFFLPNCGATISSPLGVKGAVHLYEGSGAGGGVVFSPRGNLSLKMGRFGAGFCPCSDVFVAEEVEVARSVSVKVMMPPNGWSSFFVSLPP